MLSRILAYFNVGLNENFSQRNGSEECLVEELCQNGSGWELRLSMPPAPHPLQPLLLDLTHISYFDGDNTVLPMSQRPHKCPHTAQKSKPRKPRHIIMRKANLRHSRMWYSILRIILGSSKDFSQVNNVVVLQFFR